MKKIALILFSLLAGYYLIMLMRNFLFITQNQLEYNYGVITGRIVLFIVFCLAAYYSDRHFWKRLFSRKK